MSGIDKPAVRRAFNRAAPRYDNAAELQHEVAGRLLERLAWIRLQPAVVLDLGCGTGGLLAPLMRRWRRARVLGLDFSTGMLARARRRGRPWRRPELLCADMEALPLAPGSVDLVVSSLALQWSTVPARVFDEVFRVLRPGGLFLFSTLGPDTLHELRDSWAAVDPGHPHVNRFQDMHVLGDALAAAGFADVVMDVDRIVRWHDAPLDVMRGLHEIGAVNRDVARRRGLLGPGLLRQVCACYRERHGDAQGRCPATWEVVFGHAWQFSGQRREADGSVCVPLEDLHLPRS